MTDSRNQEKTYQAFLNFPQRKKQLPAVPLGKNYGESHASIEPIIDPPQTVYHQHKYNAGYGKIESYTIDSKEEMPSDCDLQSQKGMPRNVTMDRKDLLEIKGDKGNLPIFLRVTQTQFKQLYGDKWIALILTLIGVFFLDIMLKFNVGYYLRGMIVMNRKQVTLSINWLDKYDTDLKNKEWHTLYIHGLYWAVTTLTTVGYGDIVPSNPAEVLFVTFIMFIACFSFGYCFSSIGAIVDDLRRREQKFSEEMQMIQKYFEEKQIPQGLQVEVKKYLEFKYLAERNISVHEGQQLLEKLPGQLRDKLVKDANQPFLNSVKALKDNFSTDLLEYLSLRMEEEQTVNGQVIYDVGDLKSDSNTYLYFILSGNIHVSRPNFSQNKQIQSRDIFQNLNKSAYFGELQFYLGNKRTENAKSFGTSHLLKLSRRVFLDGIKKFPVDYEKFRHLYDKAITSNPSESFQILCNACHQRGHQAVSCPTMHFIPDKEKLILKLNFPFIEKSRIPYVRREKTDSSHAWEQLEDVQDNRDFILNDLSTEELERIQRTFYQNDSVSFQEQIEDPQLLEEMLIMNPQLTPLQTFNTFNSLKTLKTLQTLNNFKFNNHQAIKYENHQEDQIRNFSPYTPNLINILQKQMKILMTTESRPQSQSIFSQQGNNSIHFPHSFMAHGNNGNNNNNNTNSNNRDNVLLNNNTSTNYSTATTHNYNKRDSCLQMISPTRRHQPIFELPNLPPRKKPTNSSLSRFLKNKKQQKRRSTIGIKTGALLMNSSNYRNNVNNNTGIKPYLEKYFEQKNQTGEKFIEIEDFDIGHFNGYTFYFPRSNMRHVVYKCNHKSLYKLRDRLYHIFNRVQPLKYVPKVDVRSNIIHNTTLINGSSKKQGQFRFIEKRNSDIFSQKRFYKNNQSVMNSPNKGSRRISQSASNHFSHFKSFKSSKLNNDGESNNEN